MAGSEQARQEADPERKPVLQSQVLRDGPQQTAGGVHKIPLLSPGSKGHHVWTAGGVDKCCLSAGKLHRAM